MTRYTKRMEEELALNLGTPLTCTDEHIERITELGQDVQTAFEDFHTALNASHQNLQETLELGDQLIESRQSFGENFAHCKFSERGDEAQKASEPYHMAIINSIILERQKALHEDTLFLIPRNDMPNTLKALKEYQWSPEGGNNVFSAAEPKYTVYYILRGIHHAQEQGEVDGHNGLATGGARDWEDQLWHGLPATTTSSVVELK